MISAVSYAVNPLVALARDFSPRYERHRDDLVSIDVSGLGRLLGPARAIGEELRREAAARGLRVHVALAGTRIAALVLVTRAQGSPWSSREKKPKRSRRCQSGFWKKSRGRESTLEAEESRSRASAWGPPTRSCRR